jgi:RNA polymerase sigma factor (sigma-70 family)
MTTTTEPTRDTALDQFLETTYAELIHFVRGQIAEQDAHDLVQDCVAVLVKKRAEVENLRAFTFQVARNKLKQYYARKRRNSGMLGFLVDMDESVPMAVLSTRLSVRVARHNDLEVAMQSLTRRQYQAFELRFVHDLSIKDTAEVLEISPATVKREIERARVVLGDVLLDATDDADIRKVVRAYVKLPVALEARSPN